MIDPTTEVIMTVYQEPDLGLVEKAVKSVFALVDPCRKVCYYANMTRPELLALIRQYPWDAVLPYPAYCNPSETLMYKYCYDMSEARFVLFINPDDECLPDRVRRQTLTLQAYNAGCSLAAFILTETGKLTRPGWFTPHPMYFLTCGYPSCWAFDKTILPTLPVPPDVHRFDVPHEWEFDLFMLIEIAKETSIVLEKFPSVIYNLHPANSTARMTPAIKAEGFRLLVEYYQQTKKQLKPLTVL